MVSGNKLSKTGFVLFSGPFLYRSAIGALQYATITRPDMLCCQQGLPIHVSTSSCPLSCSKKILCYLKGTISWGIHLKSIRTSPVTLLAYCDTDWGLDSDDRRSTSGAYVFLGNNLVSWWAKKLVVSRSSTEAEYRSLVLATTELLWLQSLLTKLGILFSTPQYIVTT